MLDLEPIKKRLFDASRGPWFVGVRGGAGAVVVEVGDLVVKAPGPAVEDEADAALVANAPTDLAALVSEVERLRGRTAQLESRLRTEDDQYHEMRAVLRELVDLKKIKDERGKTPEYEARQPKAWERARVLLFV